MGTAKEAKTILDMLTYRSAKSLGIPNYGIKRAARQILPYLILTN